MEEGPWLGLEFDPNPESAPGVAIMIQELEHILQLRRQLTIIRKIKEITKLLTEKISIDGSVYW